MPAPLLYADKLTKEYGGFRALDSLDLAIAPGEVVGLLGPNGSGKTTALRLFLGFLRATAGRASIDGLDCWTDSVEVRKRVTYLPGELRLYDSMTGRQIVQFLGKLRGDTPGQEVDDLARRLDVDPDKKLTHMSSGMKRKIALLAVLVPKVPLIILDEPTNTLDPTMRDEFLEQIKLAKAAGKAILFSSHVLQEVEAVCDRVAILRKGKLVHLQQMDELREARRVRGMLAGGTPARGPDDKPLSPDSVTGGRLDLEHRGPLPELLAWLGGLAVADLRIEPLGLGKIYRGIHANG
jgi:ABC-2 type transport system ATP-binding protein